jgi:ABC-type antimicrobial peptide transport system permease subunit
VISEEAARRYFAGREALDAVLTIGNVDRTVVGIVGDVRLGGPEAEVTAEAYVPITQAGILGGELAIRTYGDPLAIADQVRAAIRVVLPDLGAPRADTMASLLQGLIAQRQFNMMLVGIFGVLAIAIAAAGIYGVMGYIVTQRTQEIGVRMALGAVPSSVLTMILGRATIFMVLGLAIGLAASWQLATSIEAFLFEVQPHDTFVYVSAAAVLLAIGLIAAFVPARRASRVDPLVALRT